jgi:hypothetical protein
MALRIHIRPSGRLKNDFVEFDETIFKESKGHENSFSPSWQKKNDLNEVAYVMF